MCLGSNRKGNRQKTNESKTHICNLNISFWNINGYKSRIFGNKLTDSDFLKEIDKSDILGIGETHIHDEILDSLSIPGFHLLKYKNRKKSKRNNTSFGGIAVFVKNEIKKIVVPIETENQDIIWFKIDKRNLGLDNDVYVGTIYISPHKGKLGESKKIHDLAEDIINFKGRGGDIILQGDFNARISNDKDFLETNTDDLYENMYAIDNHDYQTGTLDINSRNSEDKVSDGRGKELIEMCKSLDLIIINGRKTGDSNGAATSFFLSFFLFLFFLFTPGSIVIPYSSIIFLMLFSHAVGLGILS